MKIKGLSALRFRALRAVLIFGVSAAAQATGAAPPHLFQPASLSPALASQPHTFGAEAVRVDFDLLARLGPGDPLTFNLDGQGALAGQVEKLERRSPTFYSIFGALDSGPDGSFALVVHDGVAAASLSLPQRQAQFALRYLGDRIHGVFRVDPRDFGGCATAQSARSHEEDIAPPFESEEDNPRVRPSSGSGTNALDCVESYSQPVIDILIVYTQLARDAAGGTEAIQAECLLAIDLANIAYENSRVDLRMRLVGLYETSYNEDGDAGDHLDDLEDDDDGVMDWVHDRRNEVHADFVSLWISEDADVCGKGNCSADEDEAFSVTVWSCATSNKTFHHEIGHNQGLAHDDENAGSCGYYDDSKGWRFWGNNNTGYRTVMAYNNDAGDFARVSFFSDPDVSYMGTPTGVEWEADNAKTLRIRNSVFREFRPPGHEVWVDFDSGIPLQWGSFGLPYHTLSAGISATVQAWGDEERPTVWIKAGHNQEVMLIDKPVTLKSCGGFARIGN